VQLLKVAVPLFDDALARSALDERNLYRVLDVASVVEGVSEPDAEGLPVHLLSRWRVGKGSLLLLQISKGKIAAVREQFFVKQLLLRQQVLLGKRRAFDFLSFAKSARTQIFDLFKHWTQTLQIFRVSEEILGQLLLEKVARSCLATARIEVQNNLSLQANLSLLLARKSNEIEEGCAIHA